MCACLYLFFLCCTLRPFVSLHLSLLYLPLVYLSHSPSFYHLISFSSSVLLSWLSLPSLCPPCLLSLSHLFLFSHVRNQFSWAVTHTSTAMFSRQMKRGRSDIGHAIAPQATPAWQVVHLLDLITENKGRIPVDPHLLSSLLLRGDGGWICYTYML